MPQELLIFRVPMISYRNKSVLYRITIQSGQTVNYSSC